MQPIFSDRLSNFKFTRGSTSLLLILLGIIAGTFFRISLLVIYPFIVLLIIDHFRLKLMWQTLVLLCLVALSLILSFSSGLFWQYKLLSLYYIIPFLLLLFAVPSEKTLLEKRLLKKFIFVLSAIAAINNIVGLGQFIIHPSDDSFKGIFSSYGISLYGLVILNIVLFSYFFAVFLETRNKQKLFISFLFLLSAILGFYGAGTIMFFGTFVLSFIEFRFKALLKIFFLSVISILLAYILISRINPEGLAYYKVSIRRILQIDKSEPPRKIITFSNYGKAYPKNIKDFLFGSGPGTFNSRSAFIAGSPSYFKVAAFLKADEQPYYFKRFAYPQWNNTNTSFKLHQDGFRNQPFSSLLAFLGEYGLIFTLFVGWAIYCYYRRIVSLADSKKSIYKGPIWQFRFLLLFLLSLLFIDNYFEYPEIMLLVLLILKLLNIEILERKLFNK